MSTAPSPSSKSAPAHAAGPGPSVLVEDLVESFRGGAEEIVPWFAAQMPPMYFQDTDRASQLAHLRAIIALDHDPHDRLRAGCPEDDPTARPDDEYVPAVDAALRRVCAELLSENGAILFILLFTHCIGIGDYY